MGVGGAVPIICDDFTGVVSTALFHTAPLPPPPSHIQGPFRIVAHRREIDGRLRSKAETDFLLSHFGGVQ